MTADLIITGAAVHTGVAGAPPAQAVAIKGGQICFVGSAEDALTLEGASTRCLRLGGGCVLPGLMDGHLHLPGPWLDRLYGVPLFDAVSAEEYLRRVKAFARANPNARIITGQGWENGFFAAEGGTNSGPPKELLDAICPDIPIVLTSVDVHSVWCNSKALTMCAINADTPEIPGGRIERHANGEPSGTLREEAQNPAKALMRRFPPTRAQYKRAVLRFLQDAHAMGVTGVMNLFFGTISDEEAWEGLLELEREGALRLRISGVLNASPEEEPEAVIARVRKVQAKLAGSRLLTLSTVKVFLDGVVEGKTACLKQPYAPGAQTPESFTAAPIWPDERLYALVAACDAQGLQLHFHTTGDAAVAQALCAVEYARGVNGVRDARHTIAHLHIVDYADLSRMARLGMVAAVQPYWHYRDPLYYDTLEVPYLGERRAAAQYPLASLIRAGISVAGSSDCPVTMAHNPLNSIFTGMTRTGFLPEYRCRPDCALNPDEALTLAQMLALHTGGVAYEMGREGQLGTIEVGKCADLTILSLDIYAVPVREIPDIRVAATIFDGEVVYQAL